jgi:Zn-dependent alcohol dehydrogenase
VVRLLAGGQINLDPIVSCVSPLAGWQDCFDGMHTGRYVKAVLQP